MKNLSKILFLCGVIVFTAFSCEKDNVDNKIFHVKDFSYDGCKSTSNKSSTDEYIEYKTVDENYLSVKHVNALFNCCPGKLIANAKIDSTKLIVIEDEEEHGCDCICPYDLNYKIGPLEYGQYQLVIKKGELLIYAEFPITFNSSTDTTHYINNK
ncbi:MAG: hypothetical protein K8R31_07795 [Bacteroidales bacterium]|nr:hypothetical protein [Bacteroidales bacterium]